MALIRYTGVNYFDRSGEFKVASATAAGLILTETSTAGTLAAASNAASYILEHEVIADPWDDAHKLSFLLGQASPIETKAGALCDVIRIVPGQMFEVDSDAFFKGASDTGKLTKDTAIGTILGVYQGKFREAVAGTDNNLAVLVENHIEATDSILVRIIALGSEDIVSAG